MKAKLKQFRVSAGMSQAAVAKAVGVTQPNYQRWEAGSAQIPEAKLKKLAKVLKATPAALLGRHPPIEVSLYDAAASDEFSYYGEISIHFCGGGAPLLLSISEAEFTRLHGALQMNAAFVTVESLANQTVAIRTKAVTDLYFSSDAFDDYGPEHRTYDGIDLQIPDARDWEIIEALSCDDTDDFDPTDVKRVQKKIMITDEEYKNLVSSGKISAEDVDKERARNRVETDRIFGLANNIVYQLSTGQRRVVHVADSQDLYAAFYELTEFDGGDPSDDMLRIEVEGSHRIIFVSKDALDYVSIPTHRYREGATDMLADGLEIKGGKHLR